MFCFVYLSVFHDSCSKRFGKGRKDKESRPNLIEHLRSEILDSGCWILTQGPRSQYPKLRRMSKTTVIPAKAGIQLSLDSRLRGNDDQIILSSEL